MMRSSFLILSTILGIGSVAYGQAVSGSGRSTPTVPYSQAFSGVANSATVRVAHNQASTKNVVQCWASAGTAIAIVVPDANRSSSYTDVVFPSSGGPFAGTCYS